MGVLPARSATGARNPIWGAVAAVITSLLALGAGEIVGVTGAGAEEPGSALPSSLAAAITAVTSKPIYAHSAWGIAIRDLSTGQLLYGLNANQMFVPGSLMKVYSTAAALAAYGPNYRFRTPVYREGQVKAEVLHGNLDLVASGDFSMGLREQPDGTLAFNNFPVCDHNYAEVADTCGLVKGHPLAALDQLAKQVRDAGIRQVDGNVVIDDRLFEPFDQWPDGLISPIWTNENVIDVTTAPTTPGQPARITWRPRVAGYSVTSSVKTVQEGMPTNVKLTSPTRKSVELSGQIAVGHAPLLRVSQVTDPAAFARTAFIQALERAGVRVSAPLTGGNPTKLLPTKPYSSKDRVAEHVSAVLSQFTKVILNVSYNRGADDMVCLVAVKAGSKDCEQGLVSEFHNDVSLGAGAASTYALDGAGTAEHSHTTPADATAFLVNAAKQPYGSALRSSLMVLGKTGTLATVESASPAAAQVQLKDGTRAAGVPGTNQVLLIANTMGGYVTAKSGQQLGIAIFVNNLPVDSLAAAHGVADDQGAIAVAIQQAY